MARLPRLVLPGQTHIVVHRAIPGRLAFDDVADWAIYLEAVGSAARNHRVALHAYGVRAAEVRMLVTPSTAGGLASMMRAVGVQYARESNRWHHAGSTPWEGRFRSIPVEAATLLIDCMLFVEMDAENAMSETVGIRSSQPHYAGRGADSLLTEHPGYWSLGNTPFERQAKYDRLARGGANSVFTAQAESALRGGRPLGSSLFMSSLESTSLPHVVPRPRGRPRKGSR